MMELQPAAAVVAEVAGGADRERDRLAVCDLVGSGFAPGKERVILTEVLDDIGELDRQPQRAGEDAPIERRNGITAAQHAAERIVELRQWMLGPDRRQHVRIAIVQSEVECLDGGAGTLKAWIGHIGEPVPGIGTVAAWTLASQVEEGVFDCRST